MWGLSAKVPGYPHGILGFGLGALTLILALPTRTYGKTISHIWCLPVITQPERLLAKADLTG